MEEKRNLIRTLVVFAVAVVAIFGLSGVPYKINSGWNFFFSLSIIVMASMAILIWVDVGAPRVGRLSRQYQRVGKGYGLVKVLKQVIHEIDHLRDRLERGELSEEEATEREVELMKKLSAFYADNRWKDVMVHKRRGDEAEALSAAEKLRRDYGF